MTIKELEKQYKEFQEKRKAKIRAKPTKWKRFWGWVWFLLTFSFVWVFYNIRDWRTFIIYCLVNVLVSSEIWIPFFIATVCWYNEPLRNSMISAGMAGILFWNVVPFTPYIAICIFLTIAIKSVFNKIRDKRLKKKKLNEDQIYAVLGFLFTDTETYYDNTLDSFSEAVTNDKEILYLVEDYLRSLKLDYKFVIDILSDEYDSYFYHAEMGRNSAPLPKKYKKRDLYTSEHDGQIWIDKNGRLGVWCEVDGFVAWLDEYESVWIVDSRRAVRRRKRKSKRAHKKWWKKIRKTIKFNFEHVNFDKNTSEKSVEIKPFEMEGLFDYEDKK